MTLFFIIFSVSRERPGFRRVCHCTHLRNNKNKGTAVFTAAPLQVVFYWITARFLSSCGAGCLLLAKVVMAFRIPLNMQKKPTPFQRCNADCKNPHRKKVPFICFGDNITEGNRRAVYTKATKRKQGGQKYVCYQY
jgi:hypothetical protein